MKGDGLVLNLYAELGTMEDEHLAGRSLSHLYVLGSPVICWIYVLAGLSVNG